MEFTQTLVLVNCNLLILFCMFVTNVEAHFRYVRLLTNFKMKICYAFLFRHAHLLLLLCKRIGCNEWNQRLKAERDKCFEGFHTIRYTRTILLFGSHVLTSKPYTHKFERLCLKMRDLKSVEILNVVEHGTIQCTLVIWMTLCS